LPRRSDGAARLFEPYLSPAVPSLQLIRTTLFCTRYLTYAASRRITGTYNTVAAAKHN
jgi:hypothetical protein